MANPARPAPRVVSRPSGVPARAACLLGAAGLAAITLIPPGATRMFAWPWTLAAAVALAAPVLLLTLRAFDPHRPLVLPAGRWCALAAAVALTILAAGIASPYRGPSLLWSASALAALAVFLAVFDWLHADRATVELRRRLLWRVAAGGFGAIAVVSLLCWANQARQVTWSQLAELRNGQPLGHSNYTAGLAILMLPALFASARREVGKWRLLARTAVVLAVAMLFSSGSRAGVIALAGVAIAGLALAPFDRRKKVLVALAGAAVALAFAVAHPRTRAMLAPADPSAPPNISNVQRHAMLVAGLRMGADRPLAGWGLGTTPLAYPRYRGGLDGGAESVLQLHSLPVHLWAELGAAGVGCALAFAVFALRDARRDSVAAVSLAGYGLFSFFDWQLDVPVFPFAIAAIAASLAAPADSPRPPRPARIVGLACLFAFGIVAIFGRRDPTPELNVRALALAENPAKTPRAIALLRESLASNPDQEIAHFNLGWLLLVSDPAAAERHFTAAARLVPDKGGVYFGLGLAHLNQGHADVAARAFALETLNDPAFLFSPWWQTPALAATRDASSAVLGSYVAVVEAALPAGTWPARQLGHLATALPQLGRIATATERVYRRERTGYPVLMRNLDLPVPVDRFEVREPAPPPTLLATLPPKGWLPSPLLLALLDERVSPKN